MGFLAWIAIGLIAGWIATRVTKTRGGLFRNLIVGLIGAVVGGFLFSKIGLVPAPDFWGELITAIIGAVLLLFLWRALRRE